MKRYSNKSLTKKVMLSLVAVGVLNTCVMGAAFAETFTEDKTFDEYVTYEQPEPIEVQNANVVFNNGGTIANSNTKDDRAIVVDGAQGSLTGKNLTITGNVQALNGAAITLNGGSIISKPYYEENGNRCGGTELHASDKGSNITANGVDIKSSIAAMRGASITITNSNIDAYEGMKDDTSGVLEGIGADGDGSVLTISGADNTYKIPTLLASDGGKVSIQSGKVDLAQVYVENAEVELLGGGTIDSSKLPADPYLEEEGEMQRYNGSEMTVCGANASLIGKNLDINGNVEAVNGGKITLTGGSVIAREVKLNGEIILSGINVENDANVTAQNEIIFNNVDVQSWVGAENGSVTLNNSNISNSEGLWVGKNGVINLNGDNKTTYEVESIMAIENGKINLSGGTLKADNLRDLMKDGDTKVSADGGLVLKGNGAISTMTDQIFDKAAAEATSKSDVVNVDNKTISYEGGSLIFNDSEYTNAYLNNAKDALLKYQADSKTNITMTGKLVDDTGEETKEITVDEAAKNGENVSMDNIVVNADKNLLVGSTTASGNVEGIKVEDTVANGFQAGILVLAADSTGMIVTNEKAVTLGGSNGGDVIKVGDSVKPVQVVVGTKDNVDGVASDKKAGTLNIGNAVTGATTNNQLTGSVIVNEGSTLNTKGQTIITDGVTLNNGTVNVNAGQLTTDVTISGSSTITGAVNAANLNANNSDVLNVGTKDKAGNVIVNDTVKLNGATIFLDPAFKDGAEIGDASKYAQKETELDGHYVAGQNSVISLGVDNTTDADEMFAKTRLTWKDDVTAALYVAKTTDITSGSVTVNGTLTSAPGAPDKGTAKFADNSLLMVDGNEITEKAAIQGVTSLEVADNAQLYIDGAKNEVIYKIADGNDSNVWANENITSNNALIKFEDITKAGDGEFNVKATLNSVADVFGNNVIIGDMVDNELANHSGSEAAKFFNNAVDDHHNATDNAKIAAMNNAAAMSELAGVAHGTFTAGSIQTNAVNDHMSLANNLDHDTDVWAHYVHNKENISGLSVANFGADYDATYNGIVVGADLFKQGKGTMGAALTYVDGKVTGSTKNESEYYGVSIYGSIENEDSAVIGDISYLHGKHEISQRNSGFNLTGDVKSDMFSVGVRAEKAVKTGAGKLVGYAGMRYARLGSGDYTNSIGMHYDADDANLFLLPVGLKYSAESTHNGWTLRPIVEAGYVWAMGDRDSRQTVSLNGVADGFGYDVTDSGSYIGRVMLEAEKANVTYGLGYEYQKGDSVKANKWMARLNWSF